MKRKVKIAIYSGSIPSTTFIENLIKELSVHHSIVLFGALNKPTNYNTKNITVYSTPKSSFINVLVTFRRLLLLLFTKPNYLLATLKELKKVKRIYFKWRALSRYVPVVLNLPDVFHIQWAKDLEQWLFLKEEFGVKLVLSLRGAHINYSPIANKHLAESYKRNFPKVDGFHAVSKAIALEASKYGSITSKTKVIHSPISESVFNHFKINKTKKNRTIKIVSVGRFHWKKGYKYALDAIKILKDKHIEVDYTIIASNNVTEDILFQINQLQLQNQVHILKELPQEDLFAKMQSFDVLLLPSLEEGIANVVLEAMAIGLPVISSNCGGMAEVVIPNETGWLVQVRDANAIVEAVIKLSRTDATKLQQTTSKAHNYVKKQFNAEQSMTQFLELYKTLLSDE